jgi:hypothetical protein
LTHRELYQRRRDEADDKFQPDTEPPARVIDLVPSPPPLPARTEPRNEADRHRELMLYFDDMVDEARRNVRGMNPVALASNLLSVAKAISLLTGGMQPSYGAIELKIPDPDRPKTERSNVG